MSLQYYRSAGEPLVPGSPVKLLGSQVVMQFHSSLFRVNHYRVVILRPQAEESQVTIGAGRDSSPPRRSGSE